MKYMEMAFSWFFCFAVLHTLFSWILLLNIRNEVAIRTEIFGSIKTLILGPRTMRFKYFLWASAPAGIHLLGASIRNLFFLAAWSGRIAFVLLLTSLGLQLSLMVNK
ncbi:MULTISPECIES: hypothetical protein [unclassified Polaromonas]|jgi:hypothetical protein|uniref:hypothetical protein n=1 Tax=unclassified Polaromonas TaxID=2638319 RepID=UPI000F0955E1|nr:MULTISPECIES: hypothetical protein [unclassified Polaromonas]AYQ27086.1 hypothetical protein DT070_02995 [Polaromonas sp. SP1]QGJ18069.1 hypothetical protein F7R28_06440 [Polaromonas sp. Pch-P]